jgi:hypothetical protein
MSLHAQSLSLAHRYRDQRLVGVLALSSDTDNAASRAPRSTLGLGPFTDEPGEWCDGCIDLRHVRNTRSSSSGYLARFCGESTSRSAAGLIGSEHIALTPSIQSSRETLTPRIDLVECRSMGAWNG